MNYNFNIDTDTNDTKLVKSHNNSKSQLESYKDGMFVDLELPSRTLWCKYNLGVNIRVLDTANDWCGKFYAWGETFSKNRFDWTTYEFGLNEKLTKYCNDRKCGYEGYMDNHTMLDFNDDAAYVNGFDTFKCAMPEKLQFKELIDCTKSEWVTDYEGIKGLSGRVFNSRYNNNHIFIPDTGFCRGDHKGCVGSGICHLWSKTLQYTNSNNGETLTFNNNTIYLGEGNRCNGLPIRPIIDRNVELLTLLLSKLDQIEGIIQKESIIKNK